MTTEPKGLKSGDLVRVVDGPPQVWGVVLRVAHIGGVGFGDDDVAVTLESGTIMFFKAEQLVKVDQ